MQGLLCGRAACLVRPNNVRFIRSGFPALWQRRAGRPPALHACARASASPRPTVCLRPCPCPLVVRLQAHAVRSSGAVTAARRAPYDPVELHIDEDRSGSRRKQQRKYACRPPALGCWSRQPRRTLRHGASAKGPSGSPRCPTRRRGEGFRLCLRPLGVACSAKGGGATPPALGYARPEAAAVPEPVVAS